MRTKIYTRPLVFFKELSAVFTTEHQAQADCRESLESRNQKYTFKSKLHTDSFSTIFPDLTDDKIDLNQIHIHIYVNYHCLLDSSFLEVFMHVINKVEIAILKPFQCNATECFISPYPINHNSQQ